MLRGLMAMSGLALTMLVILHFLPSVIAFFRGKHNAVAIFALNLFLGWTIIGWVGALIWALVKDRPASTPPPGWGQTVTVYKERPSETSIASIPNRQAGVSRFCSSCGAQLTSEGAFCGSCGASRVATKQTA